MESVLSVLKKRHAARRYCGECQRMSYFACFQGRIVCARCGIEQKNQRRF